jgi:pectate lyase
MGGSDGDSISVLASRDIWIDHNSLYTSADGLIDVTLASTAITISNNRFSHHDEVMLLGHDDSYSADKAMKVTVAFNHFGPGCGQRMPRFCFGYGMTMTTNHGEYMSLEDPCTRNQK